jgi:hypothetical protein
MGESAGKQIYRRYVEEVINKGNVSIIPELYHPEYVDHSAPPGAAQGSVFEQAAGIARMFRGAFPDVHFTIEDMTEERRTGLGRHARNRAGAASQQAVHGGSPKRTAYCLVVIRLVPLERRQDR